MSAPDEYVDIDADWPGWWDISDEWKAEIQRDVELSWVEAGRQEAVRSEGWAR
jgi:hypothetical protein